MKYQLTNKNLIQVLNDLGEEYKDLLLETTLRKNNEIDINNVSISELRKIDFEIKDRLKKQTKKSNSMNISFLISLLGMVYSMCGLLFLVLSIYDKSFENTELSNYAILFVVSGIIIALLSSATRKLTNTILKKAKSKNISNYEIQIINKWNTIEELVYQLSPQHKNLSLKSIFNQLEQLNILSKEELKTLNNLIYHRNIVVHDRFKSIDDSEQITQLLKDVQKIIDKLSKMV